MTPYLLHSACLEMSIMWAMPRCATSANCMWASVYQGCNGLWLSCHLNRRKWVPKRFWASRASWGLFSQMKVWDKFVVLCLWASDGWGGLADSSDALRASFLLAWCKACLFVLFLLALIIAPFLDAPLHLFLFWSSCKFFRSFLSSLLLILTLNLAKSNH